MPDNNPALASIYSNFGSIPQMSYGMTFKEVGSAGLRQWSGFVREEFLYQLQDRQGAAIYREMADNSPVIGAILFAIQSTMRKVEWRTVPADDTPAGQEMADFADSLRNDMSSAWEDAIIEDLTMLTYGYAPKEIVYKRRLGRNPGRDLPGSNYDDGRIGWRRIPLRGQDTIIKWFFDPNGQVLGLTQQPWVGPLVDIPIEKLLLFRPSHAKGNPQGRSILRNAYRSFYISKRIEEQESILFERMNGVPVIKVPSQLMDTAKGTSAEAAAAQQAIEMFKKIATNLRIDEQMGVVMPSDTFNGPNGPSNVAMYSLELVAPGGTGGRAPVTANETLTRHATNMLMSVMADFLTLGHGARGTQALAVSKVDMFFQAIEGYLNSIAAIYTRHGLRRIWDLNGLDPDLMPTYEPDLAQRIDLDVLGKYILALAQSGMAIFPNADIETAILDAAGLPDIQSPDLLDVMDTPQVPQAIVGPQAAISIAENAPPPPAAADTPFGKIMLRELAQRMKRMEGPSMPIGSGRAARARRRRMPVQQTSLV